MSCNSVHDDNCKVYPVNKACSKCQQDNKLAQETCSEANFCKVWNNDYSRCEICSDGYSFVNGACVAVPHCEVTVGDRCFKCSNGYYRDNEGECVQITV